MTSIISVDIFYYVSLFLEIFYINNLKYACKKIIFNKFYWKYRSEILHGKTVNTLIEYIENFSNLAKRIYFCQGACNIKYIIKNNKGIREIKDNIFKHNNIPDYILSEGLTNEILKMITSLGTSFMRISGGAIFTGDSKINKMKESALTNTLYFNITKNNLCPYSTKFFDYLNKLDILFSSKKIKNILYPDLECDASQYINIVKKNNNIEYITINDNKMSVLFTFRRQSENDIISSSWIVYQPYIYEFEESYSLDSLCEKKCFSIKLIFDFLIFN